MGRQPEENGAWRKERSIMEKNTKNKGTFKYGRGAAAAVILTAGAAMLSGCVAVEASKPASGAVVVSDAAQKEGTLTVVSSESVVVTPDMAEVVFGITTEDADAAACQQKNAEQLNGFVEYLKAQGISESSIMTSSFSLNPQYDWSGNTQHVAEYIAGQTGGTLFRIDPVKPYPTDYKPCTEVAKKEKEQNARPAIKNKVEDWDSYDTIFIGCPVWWWTAPMIINTFTESYNFKGKTVIPFCTYASTYRDETLAKIAELTPDAKHLKGFGAVSRNTDGITEWLKEIRVIK